MESRTDIHANELRDLRRSSLKGWVRKLRLPVPRRLSPSKGLMIGLLFSSLLWAAIIGFFVTF
ncbi:hypothetical protein [Teichococcus aestuarii]|uniref:hypothetical protein n=1 Tax=Teichococcus aestuarii TaxID=568898 RepID=UPI0011B1EE66|nr:hypothetical protein [Pseudoroseomonas aestuarii]